uniref:Uncharacterized protein n=1 Tax=Magallana gigas TaxID=29159 RepID=K1R0G2_MAGGI
MLTKHRPKPCSSNIFTKFVLGFSVYVSNTTDRLQGTLCFKDDKFTLDTIPAVFTTICPVNGQYVIYYNERLPGATYPDVYSASVFIALCEVEDALDAFILGATMDVMGLNDLNGSPQQWNPNILSMYSNEEQLSWLRNLAEAVINKHINLQGSTHLQDLVEEAARLDAQNARLHSMFDAVTSQYMCTCQKNYKTIGHFKRHLEREHNWHFLTAAREEPKKGDKVAVWRSSFMKAALILRDTSDAYKMGDGNRIFLNAKFEMLCANVAGHTKYQLWLWRMMAYEQAILTPKQAFEYKWNTTANLNGTIDGNIPNDNLVEICVQLVKKKIKEQGSNFTFNSAQTTALACQIQDELRENIRYQVSMKPSGKSRTKTDKSSDINLMLMELMAGDIFENIQGRQFENFKNIKDVFEKVNLHKLHIWISKQKERASFEMM